MHQVDQERVAGLHLAEFFHLAQDADKWLIAAFLQSFDNLIHLLSSILGLPLDLDSQFYPSSRLAYVAQLLHQSRCKFTI